MSTPYRVGITVRAARDLERLPDKISAACVELIFGALAAQPQRVGKPLRGELAGIHSARRGTYRVLYRINEPRREVIVLRIDHRNDAYRLP